MSRQYHNLNKLCNALQRTQVQNPKLKPGPLIGQSMKFSGFCLRSSAQGQHALAKPLSVIEHLMELHATPLLVLPQSKLIENTARFFKSKIDTRKCGRDWICSQN